ncbi:MAG: hypothetical protein HY22_07825 [[Candidatus Thermochlorobacteriaceae] bacterium GBChlB]|nr:MAG: hypothetical protein HY22_07825 [[Candidatus Thermochlorobacteriaceae] bacterium GBChlB]
MNSILIWALTVAVEYAVLLTLFRKERLKSLLYCTLVNAITNPMMNFAIHNATSTFQADWMPLFFLFEGLVILAESTLMYLLLDMEYLQALLWAVAANALSASLSFFL